jgi:hypothetical protein
VREHRWGTPVESEMEVVEFDPERAFAVPIRDANMQAQGGPRSRQRGPARTLVAVTTGVEGMDIRRSSSSSPADASERR